MVAAALAIAVVAGLRAGPFSPPEVRGGGPAAPLEGLSRGLGLEGLGPNAAELLGIGIMAFAVLGFLYALREAWRGHLSLRLVLGLGIAFQVATLALPLLLSRDVYSYAMYGRIAALHHANPYVATPQDFPGDPLFALVGPVWRTTPAVYGPAFTMLASFLSSLFRSPATIVLAFKVVAVLASVGVTVLVGRLARRLAPGREAFAVALFAWNPAVVAYAVAGGHNDLLVALCIAGALALLVPRASPSRGGHVRLAALDDGLGRRALAATALLTVGTLVKASAAVALVLAVVAIVAASPRARRLRTAAAHVGIVVLVSAAFAAPFFQTHDPTLGIATLATHRGWITPTRLLLATLGGLGETFGGSGGRTAVELVIRLAMVGAALYALAMVARGLARRSPGLPAAALGAGWGWAMLVFILAAPVLLPWYVVWVLPVAWLLPRRGLAVAVGLSAVLAMFHTMVEPQHTRQLYAVVLAIGHDVVGPVLLAILVWLLLHLRVRGGVPDLLGDLDLDAAPAAASHRVAARSEDD